jgi:hypothetical protein
VCKELDPKQDCRDDQTDQEDRRSRPPAPTLLLELLGLVDAQSRAHPGSDRHDVEARHGKQGHDRVIDRRYRKNAIEDRKGKWIEPLPIGIGEDEPGRGLRPVEACRVGDYEARDPGGVVRKEIRSNLQPPNARTWDSELWVFAAERESLHPAAASKDVDEDGVRLSELLPVHLDTVSFRRGSSDHTARN